MTIATLKILRDEDPTSPREWDNLGVMACWHSRYKLGDVQPRQLPDEWRKENAPKGSIVLPLYLYDHSGITMSTAPFSCLWDSGQVGWIVATPDKIREAYSVKRITKRVWALAVEALRQEVAMYDAYLRGDVWGFVVEGLSASGDGTDSCWGFMGNDAREGIKEHLPQNLHDQVDAAWEART